ncbi:MAG: hypothetical protein OXF22_11260 [Anaerolineaceae bacterium]|nr:hypothetical protein [Anaerolineaceae bacterium]
MNFLGVGGMELLLILLITVIVAGPRRMITWSYEVGRWLAKAQKLWAESARMMQRELDDAGIEIQVPRRIPTRQRLNQQLQGAIRRAASPIQEPLKEIQGEIQRDLSDDLETLEQASRELRADGKQTAPGQAKDAKLGSWSETES